MRKELKKIISAVLAAAMILSAQATAWAGGDEDDTLKPQNTSGKTLDEIVGVKGFEQYVKKYQAAQSDDGINGLDFQGVDDSLTVPSDTFSALDAIYGSTYIAKMHEGSKKTNNWWSPYNKSNALDLFKTTDWTQFSGMRETIEIASSAKAQLTDQVKKYESLMDKAAETYGFPRYKELFKAIAQVEYNEHKAYYDEAKKAGNIHGKATDVYDLFHINGSWLAPNMDGSMSPIDEAKDVAPKIEPETEIKTIEEVNSLGLTETRQVVDVVNMKSPTTNKKNIYTVNQSINYAAEAFAQLLSDAAYPSPFVKEKLAGVVNGFEFGLSTSPQTLSQYNSADRTYRDEVSGSYESFASYFYRAYVLKHMQKSGEDDAWKKEVRKYTKRYAAILAHGKRRGRDSKKYGAYKYSDQYFFEKVNEVYITTGAGEFDLNYGTMPEQDAKLLQQLMKSWPADLSSIRKNIIQGGISCYGVDYSMPLRATPSVDNPKHLDCSSFVWECYYKAGVRPKEYPWTTGGVVSAFKQIDMNSLVPGDAVTINTIGEGSGNHTGIYMGKINGTRYFMHCTSHPTSYGTTGIRISTYPAFKMAWRYPGIS